jgi:hypothetical protein
VPFLGYRDLDSDIGAAVLEGLDIAWKALGGAAFIDLHTLRIRKGVIDADSELRSIAVSFIDQRQGSPRGAGAPLPARGD